MSEAEDAKLIEQAKQGDAAAMNELLARHEKQVYRFGLRMCGNEDDAREVLQETMLAVFKNLASFRGESRLSTWMYQVARSFCVKHRRRHEGEPAQHEPDDTTEVRAVPTEEAPADHRAHARQVGEVITAAMHGLPADHREALILRDVEGLSAEEAAQVAGVEVGALKSRLHRARMALKESLGAVLQEPAGELGCPDMQRELSEYAASEIDQAACARIEAHLSTCSHCTAACDALKRTVSLCRAIPGGEVPAPVKAAVRQALRFVGP